MDESQVRELLRGLPQVEAVLQAGEQAGLWGGIRRDVITRLVQQHIAATREALLGGTMAQPATAAGTATAVAEQLKALVQVAPRRVVNATGVVLHTNLGRAVLNPPAQQALVEAAAGYCDLEMNLASGQRSRRDDHLEPQLCALLGCEAATVVNNNAAAVYLALRVLAGGREVVTSRGELIEIGGSFRIPDIMRESGCTLVEIGTTNRTRLADYERVITPQTALILKTHPSNYRVHGFTAEVGLPDLCGLARKHRLLVYYDIGSGYLSRPGAAELPEPGILQALQDGADLISFSGDKLLCGPQAGILAGRRDVIARLRRSPLWRVLRIDKFTAAALSATLAAHLQNAVVEERLCQALLATPGKVAAELAALLSQRLPGWRISTEDGSGYYGGGSLPDEAMPSALVQLEHPSLDANALDRLARTGNPPVVGYVQRGQFVLNVLALLPGDIERISACLAGLAHE